MKRLRGNGPWFSTVLAEAMPSLGWTYIDELHAVTNTTNVGEASSGVFRISTLTREFLTTLATRVDPQCAHFNDIALVEMRLSLGLKQGTMDQLGSVEWAMNDLNARLMKAGAPPCTRVIGWTLQYECESNGLHITVEHNGSFEGATVRGAIARRKMNYKRKSDKGAATLVVSLLDDLKRYKR